VSSGYLAAHGDTMTVDLVVSNHRQLYEHRAAIVNHIAWHDMSGDGANPLARSYWDASDIDRAAAAYRELVNGLSRRGYTDLIGVNLNRVDWHGLIRSELAEINLAAGRRHDAGIPENGTVNR
jgi:hypothetical protein